ncbi:hypothetical protein L596_015386 [Steinernema carpocapsae]|uniref:Uncharacterized protein n=1 Tax=Steinernema carpocapsae TaxID=34508 RepID=A0A4U5NEU0_STECR|nr:hypothetical protein L596_015386 [Steinernema carpocapsae]
MLYQLLPRVRGEPAFPTPLTTTAEPTTSITATDSTTLAPTKEKSTASSAAPSTVPSTTPTVTLVTANVTTETVKVPLNSTTVEFKSTVPLEELIQKTDEEIVKIMSASEDFSTAPSSTTESMTPSTTQSTTTTTIKASTTPSTTTVSNTQSTTTTTTTKASSTSMVTTPTLTTSSTMLTTTTEVLTPKSTSLHITEAPSDVTVIKFSSGSGSAEKQQKAIVERIAAATAAEVDVPAIPEAEEESADEIAFIQEEVTTVKPSPRAQQDVFNLNVDAHPELRHMIAPVSTLVEGMMPLFLKPWIGYSNAVAAGAPLATASKAAGVNQLVDVNPIAPPEMNQQQLLPMNDQNNGFGSALAHVLSQNPENSVRQAPSASQRYIAPQARLQQSDGSYQGNVMPHQLLGQLVGPPITPEQYSQIYSRQTPVQRVNVDHRKSTDSFWSADVQSFSPPLSSFGASYGHPEPLSQQPQYVSPSFVQRQPLPTAESSFRPTAPPRSLPQPQEIPSDSGLFMMEATPPSGSGNLGFGGGRQPDVSFEDNFGPFGRRNTQDDAINFFGR